MKFQKHLFVDAVTVPAGSEWEINPLSWRFLRVSKGVAYWLGRGANRELSEGEVMVLAPVGEGVVRASQLGEALIHSFEFCPELLGGFFTLSEGHALDSAVTRSRPSVQFLAPDHVAAQQYAQLIERPARANGLLQRCDALRLAVAFFAEDIMRQKPPPAKNTFALQRMSMKAWARACSSRCRRSDRSALR